MSLEHFLYMADDAIAFSKASRVIAAANTEQKALVMGLVPGSEDMGAVTAQSVTEQLREGDSTGIALRRPASHLGVQLTRWAEQGYLDQSGTGQDASFKRTALGDISAGFGATMLTAGYDFNVAIENVTATALSGSSFTTPNKDPIATRLPVLGLLSTSQPGEKIDLRRFYAAGGVAGFTVRATHRSISQLARKNVVTTDKKELRGCIQKVGVTLNETGQGDHRSFIDTYLAQAIEAIEDDRKFADIDPAVIRKKLSERGAIGYMIKRSQVNSDRFGVEAPRLRLT